MNNFFSVSIKTLKKTGTVRPSSRYLIRKLIKHIDFDKPEQTFVEFGTGDGCITKKISQHMQPCALLYSFEINEDFFHYAETRFEQHDNIKILSQSATRFDEIEALASPHSVDIFISSLPLTLLTQQDIDLIIEKVQHSLKPDGKFIQYQYTTDKLSYFKSKFKQVKVSFTSRNLPPAFIYVCTL
ncbi:MAG: methyltransferase domain-containing protein [Bernardetiaceae bacterium]|nr:methyltransferase domain-containing protein [Bernardetiaceae bacterium]